MDDRTLYYGAKASVFELAKELRKTMTETETLLWKMIKGNRLSGYHFRRQHPINRFIADFYCHELKLVIEIDGSIHDLQKERDEGRTEEMQAFGIHVLRYSNEEVLRNVHEVILNIQITIKNLHNSG